MPPVEQLDWASLAHETQELVSQDRHGYPKVQRDLTGLLQSSQSARARTSRVRSQEEQAAATRLLALQGFDAGRLDQDVSSLELTPTLADLFPADTASVEDYLQQIQDMTILTAIQEAQQDTILSFERTMADSASREWAADKAGLFGAVAPFTGLGGGAGAGAGGAGGAGAGRQAGGLSFGSVARADLASFGGGGAKLGPREQAYVAVVKQLNAAAAAKQPLDPVAAFGAACEQYEDRGGGTGGTGGTALMSGAWKLLGDILAGPREAGLSATAQRAEFVEAMLQGGRNHLQAGFLAHMRGVINRHRATAQRGADPDPLRDVQAFLAVKFRDRGALDLGGQGGVDTTWAQVYYALRAGLPDVALRAAERANDAVLQRTTHRSLRQLLQYWLTARARFQAEHGGQLLQDCERLLQGYNQKQSQIKHDYQLLVYALLAGDARCVDALFKLSPGLFPTMEDYLWAKLSLVHAAAAAGGGAGGAGLQLQQDAPGGAPPPPAYSLSSLQAEFNRWGAKYFTKDGKEPLLYVTVLLLTLQFRLAVSFLLKDPSAKAYRLDGIHLAIALYFTQVLDCATEEPSASLGLDLPGQLAAFGRRYVSSDSATALQYYMLAAALAPGGGAAERGRLFRELLVQSRDYGTLLGGGGPLGSGGAIQTFVPEPAARQALFESVAYDCQANQQPDEARELFLAARRPAPALRIINQQLSAAIHSQRGALTEAVSVLLSRGQAALEAIAAAPDEASRGVAAAFQQLQVVRELLEAASGQQWERALQVADKLSFLPGEQQRVAACKAEVRGLDDAVGERLSDVLLAVADAALGLRAAGQVAAQLRARAAALKVFVLDLDPRITVEVYARVNECARELGV